MSQREAKGRWQLTSLDEDLQSTAQAEHEMQRGFLLDVVVGQGATVLKLLAGEDQALLVGRDALLVLDLGLHIVDGVGGLDLQGNRLTGDCRGLLACAEGAVTMRRLTGLDEDLHGEGVWRECVCGSGCLCRVGCGCAVAGGW